MLSEAQQKNLNFFSEHLTDYLNNPITNGKYAVIHEQDLKGVYDTFEAAYADACANLPIGEFIIQQVINNSDVVEFLWSAVV